MQPLSKLFFLAAYIAFLGDNNCILYPVLLLPKLAVPNICRYMLQNPQKIRYLRLFPQNFRMCYNYELIEYQSLDLVHLGSNFSSSWMFNFVLVFSRCYAQVIMKLKHIFIEKKMKIHKMRLSECSARGEQETYIIGFFLKGMFLFSMQQNITSS